MVTKQNLEDAISGEGVFNTSLVFQIHMLRKVLGRHGRKYRRYIETVPKRGYRFTAKLKNTANQQSADLKVMGQQESKDSKPERSIAILPFPASGQASPDQHLEDGMTYALTAKLSEIRQLLVTPLRTVRMFTHKSHDAVILGRMLDVDAVVVGSIQRVANRIRGIVHLIRVADGVQLWDESFDVEFNDIFKLQASVCEKLAEQLSRGLTIEERQRLAKQYTDKPEAYDLYVKGRSYWNQRTPEGLQKAIEHFKEAIEIDPDYSVAYAGLADSYNLRSYYSGIRPYDTFPEAISWAEKALRIDPMLAEAHASRAYATSRCYWNWADADDEYKQAILLKPNYATAHQWYAEYLTAMGRFEEAIAEAKRALELDHLSPIINATLGTVFYFSRHYDEAISQYRRTIKRYPDFTRTHFRLARALISKGKFSEAIAECKKGIKLSRNKTREISQLGHAYAVAGYIPQALKVVSELEKLSTRQYVSEYNLAILHTALGDIEQAFNLLDKAYWSHDPWLEHLNVDPRLDVLRAEPRFQDLLKRVHLIE